MLTSKHQTNQVTPTLTHLFPSGFPPSRELIKRKEAFAPFSIGPYNCIGNHLAYMEVRLLTAQLMMEFDVSLPPGEDGSRLLLKTKNHFTLGLADLDLVFTKRKRNLEL